MTTLPPFPDSSVDIVHHADWRQLVDIVAALGGCDVIVTDPPFSAKTHKGHDRLRSGDGSSRQVLPFNAWDAEEVCAFVNAWSPLARGWFVVFTDDVLAPIWREAMRAAGRCDFAPLPFVAPGSRVRLQGDGPSCWTTWIVVGRPRTKEMARWGTLPGAYVLPKGTPGRRPTVVGGKPQWILDRVIEDYSRESDLVVDPCCGAGTTGSAALRAGRRALLGDIDPERAALARRLIAGGVVTESAAEEVSFGP